MQSSNRDNDEHGKILMCYNANTFWYISIYLKLFAVRLKCKTKHFNILKEIQLNAEYRTMCVTVI